MPVPDCFDYLGVLLTLAGILGFCLMYSWLRGQQEKCDKFIQKSGSSPFWLSPFHDSPSLYSCWVTLYSFIQFLYSVRLWVLSSFSLPTRCCMVPFLRLKVVRIQDTHLVLVFCSKDRTHCSFCLV